jgi:hypothetical protein
MADKEFRLDEFDAPILFGLAAQGHIPIIEKMLAQGKDWNDIGKAIGWMPRAARSAYEAHARRNEFGLTPLEGLEDERVRMPELFAEAIELLNELSKQYDFPVWTRNDIASITVWGNKLLKSRVWLPHEMKDKAS